MNRILAERRLSLTAAAALLPGRFEGRHLHPATLSRWINEGLPAPSGDRIRLESVRVGGILQTSHEALERFFDQLSPPASGADRHDAPALALV